MHRMDLLNSIQSHSQLPTACVRTVDQWENFLFSFCFLLVWIFFFLSQILHFCFWANMNPWCSIFVNHPHYAAPQIRSLFESSYNPVDANQTPQVHLRGAQKEGLWIHVQSASVSSLILKLEWTLESKTQKACQTPVEQSPVDLVINLLPLC